MSITRIFLTFCLILSSISYIKSVIWSIYEICTLVIYSYSKFDVLLFCSHKLSSIIIIIPQPKGIYLEKKIYELKR